MSYRTVCVCAMVALAVAMVSAQTKMTMSGKCDKADVQQSISVPDQPAHMYTLSQGKCSVKGDIGGVAGKDGVYSEHADVMGNHLKNWAVFVETLENGDKVFYNYQTTATMKDGALQSATNKYQIAGGTGKMKGIKGSGSCKLTGNKDGTLDYSCMGDYSMGGSAPMKQMKQ